MISRKAIPFVAAQILILHGAFAHETGRQLRGRPDGEDFVYPASSAELSLPSSSSVKVRRPTSDAPYRLLRGPLDKRRGRNKSKYHIESNKTVTTDNVHLEP